ncbi:hypothetical protein DFH09DRAFT_1105772 [Mycena vulgaris]|nr:hypothetical protein DFH09DRAFT_1105772 [Mycena vulgaris]
MSSLSETNKILLGVLVLTMVAYIVHYVSPMRLTRVLVAAIADTEKMYLVALEEGVLSKSDIRTAETLASLQVKAALSLCSNVSEVRRLETDIEIMKERWLRDLDTHIGVGTATRMRLLFATVRIQGLRMSGSTEIGARRGSCFGGRRSEGDSCSSEATFIAKAATCSDRLSLSSHAVVYIPSLIPTDLPIWTVLDFGKTSWIRAMLPGRLTDAVSSRAPYRQVHQGVVRKIRRIRPQKPLFGASLGLKKQLSDKDLRLRQLQAKNWNSRLVHPATFSVSVKQNLCSKNAVEPLNLQSLERKLKNLGSKSHLADEAPEILPSKSHLSDKEISNFGTTLWWSFPGPLSTHLGWGVDSSGR